MVVGLLGILKAGGAYVPLDPAYPRDRLLHMLADSRTPVLLTQEALLGQLPEATLRVICLDRDWPDIAREDAASLPPAAGPANPAYVIYTSGSTGRPKGVVVCHEQVVRLFRATDAWFAFNERDVWTLFHSYAFDFSVWELWGALLHGGRLVVVPYLVSRSPEAFCELLGREGVTVLNQTPSAFRQLIEAESSRPLPPGSPLRCVIFGGEALDLQSLRPWYDRHDDRRPLLVNMYGITETTVHVTYRPLNRSDVLAPRGSMIGRPIPDLSLFVLDPQGRPVPAGVPGELYVGGAGLARGYLNQPGLTAERFIAHGFDGCGARLYRTGDLVRACADGDIEYLGRVDQQVKIRGFRIEIGEVETVLRNCPGVGDALVLAVAEAAGQKRLAAYVRPAPGTRPTLDELRRHASARLPDYMVPASFSFVDQFPLTPSGKIDRKALPAASTDRPELQSAFAAPVTSAERILSGIWADILGLDRVGVTDSFFTLGGDSILSVRIVAAAKASGLDFSLADVFQHQTIRELAAHARRSPESAAAGGTAAAFELLSEADRNALPPDLEDAYPLARLQAGMLFHAQLNPDSAVYCNLSSLHLRVPFNAVRLQEAIDHVVDRHPALRSWFDLSRYTEPLQLVARRLHLPLQVEDLRHLDEAGQDRFLREWIDAERTRGFDSERLPLVRFRVHRRADDRIQLTWCEHHAILDGWSVATMLTEILGEYLRRLGCEVAVDTSGPAGTFRDFIVLERDSVDSAEARDFWRGKLAGMTATRLPRWRREEGLEPRRRFGQHPVPVPADLSDRLHELARQLGVPIKSVLLAAHLKVLSAWSGRRDVLTGLISNGRPETTGSERVLGLFLNTVPLAVDLGPGTWADLVRRAHAGELEILPHRRYPLAEIQRALGTQDLVETSFNFIHFHVYQGLTGLGPVQVLDALAFERTNFTLMATFGLDPLSERSGVGLTLHYDARELAAEQVRALAESYLATLQAMTILPAGRHESTCLLPDGHRRLVLEEFNETSASRPAARCLHELFAAQADRTPDAVALVCGDETLTYDALRKRSDRLADCLRSQGVGPEVPVGVCMERTAELVVALLAVLKAGGAYVPLDAAYPPERLAFILADAGAPVVLAGVRTLERLVGFAGRVINVGDLQRPLAPGGARGLEEADAPGPSNLAYIIYTSGSTGRPKGVAIEHRSVFEFIQWARGVYSDAELAGVLASTSVCFDLSIFELFVPLSWGGRVILVANALALPEVEPAARVTLVNTVPSAMAELMRLGGLPRSVRTVNLAGEPLSAKLVDQVYRGTAVQRVFDLYGPSEDTTYSTAALRSAGQPATIGGPISNTRIYILDANLQPVPMGAVGELYISGAGLARGYWRRPDLTAERFIPDPFSRSPGARMYCTGDLGRHRRDGCIEFLGRSDHQVKIRGFRIELGEIEATLAGCPGVASAVLMVAGGEADQRLVAYFVRQDGHAVEAGELRAYLAARLPAYMIPVGFVELEAMPQTPNGKIDRRRLPAWTGGALRSETVTTVPRDDVEERVAQCWRELLGVDDIGVDTDFFTLGGHSLLATQAVARLREQFGVSLPLRSLFDAPTVAGVAEVIRQARSIQAMSASPAGDGGDREEIEL
jgi:amino acid adenylation domain-containing protein